MSASKRMNDKSKIIEFPNSLRKATQTYDKDDFYDFEKWVLPAELLEKDDVPALVVSVSEGQSNSPMMRVW